MSDETTNETAACLALTREWGLVFTTLAADVVECLETVTSVELRAPGHPFYHGKMSLLQTLRRVADSDEARFAAGASTLDALRAENARLRAALEQIANHDDAEMAQARTLHYDMRGWAREALG